MDYQKLLKELDERNEDITLRLEALEEANYIIARQNEHLKAHLLSRVASNKDSIENYRRLLKQ